MEFGRGEIASDKMAFFNFDRVHVQPVKIRAAQVDAAQVEANQLAVINRRPCGGSLRPQPVQERVTSLERGRTLSIGEFFQSRGIGRHSEDLGPRRLRHFNEFLAACCFGALRLNGVEP